MARFEVQVINARALLDVPGNVTAVGNLAFRLMVDEALMRAKENVASGASGLRARSGRLYRSLKKGPYRQWKPGGIGEQTIYIAGDGFYGALHETGKTKNGRTVITPVRAQYLVFRVYRPTDADKPSGPWVRAKQVRIVKRPFLAPAAEAAVRGFGAHVQTALRTVVRGGLPPGVREVDV
jgi:hypothetical protein